MSLDCKALHMSFPGLFFFTVSPTTEFYTLSLHDALPIFGRPGSSRYALGHKPGLHRTRNSYARLARRNPRVAGKILVERGDRKSTRLNSSHVAISYAVFCLKKKRQLRRF